MQLEEALYAGLCELWPGKERRERMRLVAMVAISAMRFATDRWLEQDGKRPLPKHVRDAFQKLQEEFDRSPPAEREDRGDAFHERIRSARSIVEGQ